MASSENTSCQTTTLAESTPVVDPISVPKLTPPTPAPIRVQTTTQARASSLLGALDVCDYGSNTLDSLLATRETASTETAIVRQVEVHGPVAPSFVSISENEATFSQVDLEVVDTSAEASQASDPEAAYEQWAAENPEEFVAAVVALMKPMLEDGPTTSRIRYAQEPHAIDSASSLPSMTPTLDNSYPSSFTAHTFSQIPRSSHPFTPPHFPLSLLPPTSLPLTQPYLQTQDSYMSEPLSLSNDISKHNASGSTSVLSEPSLSHTSGCLPTKPHVVIDRKDDGDFNLDCTMIEASYTVEGVECTPLMESAAWTGDEGLMDVLLGDSKFGDDYGMGDGDGDGFDWEFWKNAGVCVPEVAVEDMVVGSFEWERSLSMLACRGQDEADFEEDTPRAWIETEEVRNVVSYMAGVDAPSLEDLVFQFATMSIQDDSDIRSTKSKVETTSRPVQCADEASSPLEITTVVPPTPTFSHSSELSTPTTVEGLSTPFRPPLPPLSSSLLRPPALYPLAGSRTSMSPSPSPTSTLVSPLFAFSHYKFVLPEIPRIPDWSNCQNKVQLQVAEEDVAATPIHMTIKSKGDAAFAVAASPSKDAVQPVIVPASGQAPTPSCHPRSPGLLSASPPASGKEHIQADQPSKTNSKSTRRKPRKPKFRVVVNIECWRRDVDVAIHGPMSKHLQPSTPSAKLDQRSVMATQLRRGYRDRLPEYYSMPGSWRWELPQWECEC